MAHQAQSSNAAQQNIALTRKLFDEVFNKENLAACDELFAANVKFIDPAKPHLKAGVAAVKEMETTYCKAFPKKKIKIDDIFAAEDRVVVRWTCQGVQKGELQGIAASNKPFTITGISIYRFANGKITEVCQNWDRLALLEQIGEISPALALH